jgi:hypothetical protein
LGRVCYRQDSTNEFTTKKDNQMKSPVQQIKEAWFLYQTQQIVKVEFWDRLEAIAEEEQSHINMAYSEGHYDHKMGANRSNYFAWKYDENILDFEK